MKEIPTPETDAFSVSFKSIDDQLGKKKWVPVDLARRLERERNEEHEIVESLTTTAFDLLEQLGKAREQRDEANEELHKQLVQYDQLFDEAEKIRIERDEAREALKRIYQASMVAQSLEEDFAEWEKSIEMLLDLIKKEAH